MRTAPTPFSTLVSLLVILLAISPSLVSARPTFGKRAYNATLAAIVKQRQTSTHEIKYRAHLAEVTTRVFAGLAEDKEDAEALLEDALDLGGIDFVNTTRGEGQGKRAAKLAERVKIAKRAVQVTGHQVGADRQAKKGSEEDAILEGEDAEEASRIAGLTDEQRRRLREVQRLMEARELGERLEAERRAGGSEDEVVVLPERQLYKRGNWPKCASLRKGEQYGYAHYQGWRIIGDELSGAIPVSPEPNCIQACNKYGGSCAGVSYLGSRERCMLKGTRASTWKFLDADKADAVDLIGGCSLWANIVPKAMHATCCEY